MKDEIQCLECESEFQILVSHTFKSDVCFCPFCGSGLVEVEED